jgi:sortase (surface protein transpeptidase)
LTLPERHGLIPGNGRVVVGVAVFLLLLGTSASAPGAVPRTSVAGVAAPSAREAESSVPSPSAAALPEGAHLPRSSPVSLEIPKINASSSLMSLGLNPDRTVEVPPVSNPMQAGWYRNGPTPGEIGPAVLLGHVDGDHRAGIFFRLHELSPDDEVRVRREDGTTARFSVRRVDLVPKNAFPTEAVYGDTADAQLRLITCGGAFDRSARSYVSNVIVYATLLT